MAADSKSGSKNQRLFHWPGLIEHYRRFLPVTDSTPVVTLNEGNTPLIEAPAIAERLGLNIKVYFKFEGANPTGSFKDRGMTLAISKALGEGARAVICASTGNTAASAAAYAGRAGLQGVRADPKGRGRARQAVAKRDAWRARARGDRQLRHLLEGRARCRRARPGQDSAGQQRESRSNRGAEDGGVRDLRSTRRRADASFSAGRQRRQYHGVLGGLPGIQVGGAERARPEDDGLPGGGVGADCRRASD